MKNKTELRDITKEELSRLIRNVVRKMSGIDIVSLKGCLGCVLSWQEEFRLSDEIYVLLTKRTFVEPNDLTMSIQVMTWQKEFSIDEDELSKAVETEISLRYDDAARIFEELVKSKTTKLC